MNYSTAVMLINTSIRAMKTIYEPESTPNTMTRYTFKTLDPSLKVGDLVLVPSSTRFGYVVNKIVEADVEVDFDASYDLKWIVCPIDLTAHKEVLEMEAQAIALIKKGELRKRREDIKKNTLDAYSAGEIDNLAIAKIGSSIPSAKTALPDVEC